jgi:acetyltransferase-like isoleucine patch superfamily enzyme
MRNRIRLAAAVLISVLPFSALRCALYRWLFGYSISNARIGFATVILAREVNLNGCTIGRFNKFLGPMRISIGSGADIETHNIFDCGEWTADELHADRYERTLIIEPETRITNQHFFDVAGRFFLGQGSWIAGRGSQFWTHGVNVADRNVSIGRSCYIGSAVRFAPGSGVGDNVIVGIGSVVTKRIETSNALIAGFPAEMIKEGRGWQRPSRAKSDGAS